MSNGSDPWFFDYYDEGGGESYGGGDISSAWGGGGEADLSSILDFSTITLPEAGKDFDWSYLIEEGRNPADWMSQNALTASVPGESLLSKVLSGLSGGSGSPSGGGSGAQAQYKPVNAQASTGLSSSLVLGALVLGALFLFKRK